MMKKGNEHRINPTLVIMAGGMGSRYGGCKQIDPVGDNGEIIMDYSIYDAVRAGFDKVVFIIRREIEEDFRAVIGDRISKVVNTTYVYQDLTDLPEGFAPVEGREKPWGTGHAVRCCKDVVKTPFVVINADDFYGPSSFDKIYEYLMSIDPEGYDYGMVGFEISKTLTENGTVARGVCTVDDTGYLQDVQERTAIKAFEDGPKYTEDGEHWVAIPSDAVVSMNTWGFTPTIFDELDKRFVSFLDKSKENLLKAEYFLPSVVDELIKEHLAKVEVVVSHEQWHGVTYREDKEKVQQAIRDMVAAGTYPSKLWEK
ncbi:MAG: nucleotidyltransferase family protein [Cellulosilyticaceae bacterium]